MSQKSRWAEIEIAAPAPSVEAVGPGNELRRLRRLFRQGRARAYLVIGYLPVDDRLEGRLYELKDHIAKLPSSACLRLKTT